MPLRVYTYDLGRQMVEYKIVNGSKVWSGMLYSTLVDIMQLAGLEWDLIDGEV